VTDRRFTTLRTGGAFFEGPRWRDGRWWVSDMFAGTVWSIDPSGGAQMIMTVEGQPSGLGWLPDGSLLIVSMKDRRILRRSPSGKVGMHADLGSFGAGWANDMVVDAAGRAYVGMFGFDLFGGGEPRPTVLVRVEPDGACAVAADELMFPNGAVITPEGDRLIVGETFARRYTAFQIRSNGELHDRSVWAALEFRPDGCTMDAEGMIWSATTRASCSRIAPAGEIVDEISTPNGLRVYACMLGGAEGRTLLLSALPDGALERTSRDHSLRQAVLLTTAVDVPHAGLP